MKFSWSLILFFALIFVSLNAIAIADTRPRVVSLVPSQTEMLFELGLGQYVVGVSDFCNFPHDVMKLPKLGGMELNLEKLVSAHPTIVFDLNGMHRRYELFFNQVGIDYQNMTIRVLNDIPKVGKEIAEKLGFPEKGREFAENWEKDLLSEKSINPKNLKVYVEIWDSPLQGAGRNSFIGEMVAWAGGTNVLSLAGSPFPVVNSEEVIQANPEVIIIAYPVDNLKRIRNRPGWSEISAVKNGRIHVLDSDPLVRPGPRCIMGIKNLKAILKEK